MARLISSKQAFADLECLTDFLLEADPVAATEIVDLIVEAVSILERHPLMGRPIDEDIRELIISRGRTGYVALYCHEPVQDAVLVLGIRHQRDAGYSP